MSTGWSGGGRAQLTPAGAAKARAGEMRMLIDVFLDLGFEQAEHRTCPLSAVRRHESAADRGGLLFSFLPLVTDRLHMSTHAGAHLLVAVTAGHDLAHRNPGAQELAENAIEERAS